MEGHLAGAVHRERSERFEHNATDTCGTSIKRYGAGPEMKGLTWVEGRNAISTIVATYETKSIHRSMLSESKLGYNDKTHRLVILLQPDRSP